MTKDKSIFIKNIYYMLSYAFTTLQQPDDDKIATLPVMRGKINMPGTIKNKMEKKQRLTCEFDELSENNLLNQILKTTVMILLRHAGVDAEYKNDLKKEMLFSPMWMR